ncbi:hypothetical protein D3C76_1336570 [compost metagenome]
MLAAVTGVQQQVEHPDCIAVAGIGEPHVEQRLVGALCHQALALAYPARPDRVRGRGQGFGLVVRQHLVTEHPAVQLLFPAQAAIAAVQDHPVVTHRPPKLRRREGHRVEVGADRHLCLLPVTAMVIRVQDVPARPHRDHPCAGAGDIAQGAARGQRTGQRWQVEHVDVRLGLDRALQRGPGQQQHAAAFEHIHP